MRPRAWREWKGLTCAQVAEMLSVKEATVSRYETGLRLPSPDMQTKYHELTEGAVTLLDWNELWKEPEAVAARAKDAQNEKNRKAAAA